MRFLVFLILVLVVISPAGTSPAQSVFIPTTGTVSWNTGSNWTPSGVPNAVGAATQFSSPTGGQTVNLGAAITVGSIQFTNNSANVVTLANGTGGSLTMDQDGSGAGEASIVINGTSTATNNVTISASVTLNDTLRVTVNQTGVTGSGAATFTGAITGSGDFIKDGPGRLSMTSVAKAFTGATFIQQGRIRFTTAGALTGTSGITVSSGGMLMLDAGSGAFTFGGGTALITLNGTGTGEVSQGAGALRNQGSGTSSLANPLSLATTSVIHVDGGSSVLNLLGAVSGSGSLSKSGGGTLGLTVANSSFTGGTIITNGTVTVAAASNLGTGALSFEQSTGNNTTVNLNNATQSVGSLSSTWADVTGTQTQTLNLNGTALTVNQAVNGVFGPGAVSTLQSVITGSGSLTKAGSAMLTLGGANTLSGGVTVSDGTLNVLNASGSATGSGTVTVDAGMRLSGTGRIAPGAGNYVYANGALHVGDYALSTPTASEFTVDVSGSGSALVTAATAQFEFDLFTGAGTGLLNATTAADVLKLLGTLNSAAGGTLVIANPNALSGFSEGDAWTLFDLTGGGTITNDFALDYTSLALGPTLAGSFDRTSGVFSIVAAIPEPSRVLLLGAGLGLLGLRRRRSSVKC